MSDFETVREFLGYIDYREHQDGNPWEALRMIEDRLRDAEERAAVKEPLDYIEGLEVRLSAVIEEENERLKALVMRGQTREAEILDLQARLSAAEKRLAEWEDGAPQADLKRAEEVVEAAKNVAHWHWGACRVQIGPSEPCTCTPQIKKLRDAIRRYEEGK